MPSALPGSCTEEPSQFVKRTSSLLQSLSPKGVQFDSHVQEQMPIKISRLICTLKIKSEINEGLLEGASSSSLSHVSSLGPGLVWQDCQPLEAACSFHLRCHHLVVIFLIFRHPISENNKESVVEFGGLPNLPELHINPHPTPWGKTIKES